MSDGQDTGQGTGSEQSSAPTGSLGSQSAPATTTEQPSTQMDWRDAITDASIKNSPTIAQLEAGSSSEALDLMSKQLVHAQQMVGADKIPKLKETATPEERKAYLNEHFGVPTDKGNYDFGLPEDAGDDIKEVAGLFQDIAFDNDLTATQAKALYEKVGEYFNEKGEASKAAQEAEIKKGLDGLREEWGDRYDAYLKQANNALERLNVEGADKFFEENPAVSNSPVMMKLFQKMAAVMMEDAPVGTNNNYATSGSSNAEAFENSPEWRSALSKVLSGNATPAEEAEYNRLRLIRDNIYATAG